MINNINDARQALMQSCERLAFIVGNGINRFAYQDSRDLGWERLLLKLWNQCSSVGLKEIPKQGISFPEFYDLLVLDSEAKKVDDLLIDEIRSWTPTPYHANLQRVFMDLNSPVLTTNFDKNLENGLTSFFMNGGKHFSDYYLWDWVHRSLIPNPSETNSIYDFGIWHINGCVDYKRSLRFSLSQYAQQTNRAASLLHKVSSFEDDFILKNQEMWKGHNTWLHLIFNCDLCIFGLGLGPQETFLRWLLIERTKYFKRFPERKRRGWYVWNSGEKNLRSNQFFLERVGFEIIELSSYEQVYYELLDALRQ